jgi:hypothetical protein
MTAWAKIECIVPACGLCSVLPGVSDPQASLAAHQPCPRLPPRILLSAPAPHKGSALPHAHHPAHDTALQQRHWSEAQPLSLRPIQQS